MEKTIYNAIKASLTSSMTMKLEHIKRFLSQGKASVMIGAGFSKNAEMDSTVKMKDWNGLVFDFYKRLYSKEPTVNDLVFKSPIRLASLIEASFGRTELDELILNSLPDDRIFPGELHNSLLKLAWKDVFTTNYDTLLEKACADSGRNYEIVTNKDTLLYKPSPRIIKLHGSFKDIRPFIMTEEDYRTYAQSYPEFVNTVRQSLIEGTLCLIGFSGDDPNFLNWIGWLRDIMGKHLAPVYTIVFDKDIHSSEINLSRERGLEIINFAGICVENKEITRSDSLDFFFKYMEDDNQDSLKWSGRLDNYSLDNSEEIKSTINRMKSIRETYPGWIYLPVKFFSEFKDMDTEFPFLEKEIKNLSHQEKIDFIYELDWRLTVSLTPKALDWYLEVLTEIIEDKQLYSAGNKIKIDTLKISLLGIYRINQNKKNYERLKTIIEESNLNNELKRKFYYEQSLYTISILDYKSTSDILNIWEVSPYDYIGILWKSAILIEINRIAEANAIMNNTFLKINHSLLIDEISPYLKTLQSVYDIFLYFINPYKYRDLQNKYKSDDLDLYDLTSFFKKEIYKYVEPKNAKKTHGFNIDNIITSWSSGESGYQSYYSYSFRVLALYESVGYIMAMPNLNINEDVMLLILPNLFQSNLEYAISIMLRTANTNIVEKCINRSIIKSISRNKANNIFDTYYDKWNINLKQENSVLYKRLVNVLIPFLSRLSVKLSSDRIIKLFEIQKEIFLIDPVNYKRIDLRLIYNSLDQKSILKIITSACDTEIESQSANRYFIMPHLDYCKFIISEKALSIILEGLLSKDPKTKSVAFNRLKYIYPMLNEMQKGRADDIIYNCRNNNKLSSSNLLYSYNILPYNSELDKVDLNELISNNLTDFINSNIKVNGKSDVITNFDNSLSILIPNTDILTIEDHEKIICKLCDFLEFNDGLWKVDDSDEWFGGFREFTNTLLRTINDYFFSFLTKSKKIEKHLITRLSEIVKKYYENKCVCFALYVQLSFYINDSTKEIKNVIDENILSNEEIIRTQTVSALSIAARSGYDIQLQLNKLVDYIELIHDPNSLYIRVLTELYCFEKLGKKIMIRIPKLLERLYLNIDYYSLSDEYKTDLYYYVNKFAGTLSVGEKDTKMENAIKIWRKYSENEENFNDVRMGFEHGIEYIKSIRIDKLDS